MKTVAKTWGHGSMLLQKPLASSVEMFRPSECYAGCENGRTQLRNTSRGIRHKLGIEHVTIAKAATKFHRGSI
jgi:hypothetical protein